MAETDRDDRVTQAYRALGGEEPPRALDAAILAAARRRPARWRVPLSIAAVLVLAVGVTLRMLPPEPDGGPVALAPQVIETPRPAAPAAGAARSKAGEAPTPAETGGVRRADSLTGAVAPRSIRAERAPAAAESVARDAAPRDAAPREANQEAPRREAIAGAAADSRQHTPAAPAAPAAVTSPAAAASPAAPAPRALASAKLAAPATPEAWLERIAELKKQGRAREAEESLAEFKKRYPDYKIPEALTR